MSRSEQEDTIVVFTARSPSRIIREGGSQAWVLNPARAKLCQWVLCTQNRHNPDYDFSDATEPHGEGFLLGRVSRLMRSNESQGIRWLIEISEYARVRSPDAWDHGRNPIRYTSLSQLGIDPSKLKFEPIPSAIGAGETPAPRASLPAAVMAEAKRSVAAAFGVKPDAVEITIRG